MSEDVKKVILRTSKKLREAVDYNKPVKLRAVLEVELTAIGEPQSWPPSPRVVAEQLNKIFDDLWSTGPVYIYDKHDEEMAEVSSLLVK